MNFQVRFNRVFSTVTPEVFLAARNRSSRLAYLTELTPADLVDYLLILNTAGSGVAVSPSGDIQNLFRNPPTPPGMGARPLVMAIDAGRRTLDCYDGPLPRYYRCFGFEETARVKFDPAYAHGVFGDAPDVVYMRWRDWPRGGPQAAILRAADRNQWARSVPAAYVADEAAARRVL